MIWHLKNTKGKEILRKLQNLNMGKHFLICFKGLTLRVYFLMFGSCSVNEIKPDRPVRLNLTFKTGEINFIHVQ